MKLGGKGVDLDTAPTKDANAKGKEKQARKSKGKRDGITYVRKSQNHAKETRENPTKKRGRGKTTNKIRVRVEKESLERTK